MDELLKFRIRGFIQQEDFRRRIEESLEAGGVGLNAEHARDAGRYLEKLLAQGIYL
jgi:hypothetical protein